MTRKLFGSDGIRELFGTDGIRGTANLEPMTASTALKVGMATAAHFMDGDHRHRVVIGKDTRLSGYMIEPALVAGFVSMGMDVILIGPMPTPAVAMLTRSLRADIGVMISASHNPYQDNGIKLFGRDGYKLSDAAEADIEKRIHNGLENKLAEPMLLGKAKRLEDAGGRYTEYVKQTFPKGLRLDGLKVVIDCANGAAYKIAPEVLWELGAEVIPVGVDPDGFNINKGCGSTDLDALKTQVAAHQADIGLALDGDADRLLVVDENSNPVDGDQLMALIATHWHQQGRLNGGAVVATVMSNLGFERCLTDAGLKTVRTQVGDRYVVEAMRDRGCNIGGEQSGHIILSDYSTTGDGLIAALQILSVLVKSERKASDVCRLFDALPQVLKNVKFSGSDPLTQTSVQDAIKAGDKKLQGTGRLLVRKSGTEPLIRVMVEGEDLGLIDTVIDDIVQEIQNGNGL